MAFCTGCGHRLGDVGRFCTNCGRPISADPAPPRPPVTVPTGPPPSGPPPSGPPPSGPPPSGPPPPAYTQPSAPRYPLFVDEVRPASADPASAAAPVKRSTPGPPAGGSGPSFLVVALVVVVLMLVAVVGGLLMFSGSGDDDAAEDPAPGLSTARSESAPPSRSPSTPPPSKGSQDVARYATVTAPRTARPNLDTRGNQVRYEPSNMVDGVPSTCWRTPGDGTGIEITFEFPQPVELTEVGLINGYAKQAGRLDWYAGNRKVLAVDWVFDDGTVVPQTLDKTRDLQAIEIDPVTTTTVRLRLESVSPPGAGPAARDYTPISDVALIGAAA